MNCAKCQYKMSFQERICRRCQYCAESDTYVSVDVPRRTRRGVQKLNLRIRFSYWISEKLECLHRTRDIPPVAQVMAGICPGLGQIFMGRFQEGLLYAIIIPVICLAALFSKLDTSSSLTLLGISFGIHVTSLFRLGTVGMRIGLFARVAVHGFLILTLAVLIYNPLSSTLMTYKPEFSTLRTSGLEYFFRSFWLFAGILTGAWLLGKFLSLVFSLPERRHS